MQNEKSNFNQALWLGIGQLCTFLIAFLTAPILTRYFDKVEYGTYRQILYVYTSLMALFTLGLPSVFAYFIPRLNTAQQKSLINGITKIFLLLGLCFSVALYLLSDFIADLLNNPELATGLKLFSPFPLFTLPTLGVEGIYTALKKTKFIAVYQVLSKILTFVCIILPVILWRTGYREAIIGWGVASFLTFLMAMYLKRQPYVGVKAEIFPNMYRSVFNYCLPLTGAFLAGFFCNSADQFFISRYYGTETFAVFSSGIFTIPIIAMVATSVKQVLVPVISKAESENRFGEAVVSYRNAIVRSAIIIIPMLTFCFFLSTDVMVALFGAMYEESASYFRIHIVKDFITIFPYFSVLAALGLNRFYMNMHIVGALIIWIFDFVICGLHWPPQLILGVSTSFSVGCSIAAFVYIKHKSNVAMINAKLMWILMGITLHCSIAMGIVLLLRTYVIPDMNVFISLIACGILFYALIIPSGYIFKYEYIESLLVIINKRNGRKRG